MNFYYLVKVEDYENLKKSCDTNVPEKEKNREEAKQKEIIDSVNIPDEVKLNLLSQKENEIEEKQIAPEQTYEPMNDKDIAIITDTLPGKYKEAGKSLLLHLLNHIQISKYGFVKHEKFTRSLKIENLLRSILVNRAKIYEGVEELLEIIPIDEKFILNSKLIRGGSSSMKKWEQF